MTETPSSDSTTPEEATEWPHSVLMIDDSEADRYYSKIIFSKCNPSTTFWEATDGQAGLDFLTSDERRAASSGEEYPPSIVLLDINMPGMGGFEFLEEFEQVATGNPFYQSLVVVMLSSSSSLEDRERCSNYACVRDYITKPLTIDTLASLRQKFAK